MDILDSGAVSFFAAGSPRAQAMMAAMRSAGQWPATILSVTLVECLSGQARDASTYRFLRHARLVESVPRSLAREAARLRHLSGRGSAVDALLVAFAQSGTVVTGDNADISALAAHARDVRVVPI